MRGFFFQNIYINLYIFQPQTENEGENKWVPCVFISFLPHTYHFFGSSWHIIAGKKREKWKCMHSERERERESEERMICALFFYFAFLILTIVSGCWLLRLKKKSELAVMNPWGRPGKTFYSLLHYFYSGTTLKFNRNHIPLGAELFFCSVKESKNVSSTGGNFSPW